MVYSLEWQASLLHGVGAGAGGSRHLAPALASVLTNLGHLPWHKSPGWPSNPSWWWWWWWGYSLADTHKVMEALLRPGEGEQCKSVYLPRLHSPCPRDVSMGSTVLAAKAQLWRSAGLLAWLAYAEREGIQCMGVGELQSTGLNSFLRAGC